MKVQSDDKIWPIKGTKVKFAIEWFSIFAELLPFSLFPSQNCFWALCTTQKKSGSNGKK